MPDTPLPPDADLIVPAAPAALHTDLPAGASQEPEPAQTSSEPPPSDDASVAAPIPAPAIADLSPAQCSARLAALFPALFGQHQPHPLKLRIQADIQARAPGIFNRKSLSAFLHRYTTGTPYLLALTRSPQRVDLDGAPAGEVADEHREAAVAEVARRRTLLDARRAAEQTARRESEATARQQREEEQQSRRERAALLRAFETSTVTRANFCALKRLQENELDALLAQARQEAAQAAAAPPPDDRAGHRPGHRGDPESRGDPRPERSGGPGRRPRRPQPGP